MRSDSGIAVVEATTNNLKSISCTIPHGALTVVTGVSGSGKSSLAFDTIYAEGQRRYVETLSTYARQFLDQMPKPPVKAVRHVPPALALRQGNSISNARSTVSTVTELVDHLQLLFAAGGTTWCKSCGERVERYSVKRVIEELTEWADGARAIIVGRLIPDVEEEVAEILRQLVADGHRRALVDGAMINLDSPDAVEMLGQTELDVVIDRLKIDPSTPRLSEAIENAFSFGECSAEVVLWDDEDRPSRRFYDQLRCAACGTRHLDPVPAIFDPRSTVGGCRTCEGFGRTAGVDPNKVVPDPRKSLADGAVACFETPAMRKYRGRMLRACQQEGVPTDRPWMELPESTTRQLLGSGVGDFIGVAGFFEKLEEDRYKPHIRIMIARYRGYAPCPTCRGSGLSADARAVRIDGDDIGDAQTRAIDDLLEWIRALQLPEGFHEALEPLLREIDSRLQFLVDSGVGYLSLARPARTLSGGEMHRVLLATSVGRMLTDTCYVLDEPTAGLHAHDTARLMRVVTKLRDIGNTVVVVEHDPDVMAMADHVVELGPRGGDAGGEILFEGTSEALNDSDTPTGESLRTRRGLPPERPLKSHFLTVSGVCLNNLRDVRASFPIGAISVVTGVSGSGKSSLVADALYAKLLERRGQRSSVGLGTVEVHGDEFDEVVLVDQRAVQQSTRSCAMTFSGAYSPIRQIFAATPVAQARSLSPGDFSFNTVGGRCERCDGTGVRVIEMHFMADVALRCDVCDGRRFKPHVLDARYRGACIADVFGMTVDETIEFFADSRPITGALVPLQKVGLGYVTLGQSTSQMSGGELQRLKLASYVGKSKNSSSRLFVFDEPTVGLHMLDVDRLMTALRELIGAGNTVIVVEHNLDFVAQCDWVVDLGPGAGPDGGSVMYEGRVAGLADCAESLTGKHLAAALG